MNQESRPAEPTTLAIELEVSFKERRSPCWINQVERFFALLAGKQIKRGTHTSVKELIAATEAFISQHHANPKPLRWTKSADDILATIERFCRRTLDVHAQTG